MDWLRKIFDNNERDIQKYRKVVEQINALEPALLTLSDEQLSAKTDEFRQRVQEGWQKNLEALERTTVLDSERKDKTRKSLDDVLDEILPEAFAVVREAGRRMLGQRHYDVQLIGGMVTHDGRIGELRTGEGKTLMATLPLYLNALAGRGAHLVTANDYLSKVGAVWMGPIYNLLGMSVGIIQGQSPETGDEGGSYIFDLAYEDNDPRSSFCRPCERREAYACDVTYGTNNEFGFDYLRDNMAFNADSLAMRDLHYAIIDEVDSILIDEARTPLIISGFVDQSTEMYSVVDKVIRTLKRGVDAKSQADKDDPNSDKNNPNIDYLIDEKAKTVNPTDAGLAKMERMLGVDNLADNPEMMHYVTASMKAHALFRRDIDYVIKETDEGPEIVIVDEFTGRLMFGRRYSDGLHQSIEAKEGVPVKHESQTLATITFQNLFRLYLKLAGMTGTAKTEEDEFRKIYGLDVVMVPTNRPLVRKDMADVIYKSAEQKWRGIAGEILGLYARQQPVLVGTRSIEMSEKVSDRIKGENLQLLAMVSLIRTKLESSKNVDKSKLSAWNELLNSPLEKITLAKLAPIAKELGINPDPIAEENLREIASMLEITPDEEILNNIDEALRYDIPHNVLNAKFHEKEAVIIAEAGRKGAVTIATNMAGRGVDILLGGKPHDMDLPPGQETTLEAPSEEAIDIEVAEEVDETAEAVYRPEMLKNWRRGGKPGSILSSVSTLNPDEHRAAAEDVRALGGLYILGTERHESRRIDNQLRGRAGRQGDPGASRFYVSLEDELWRLFGDRTQSPLLRGWPEHEAMDARILSKMIERAQKKVEESHFESRKQVLQYDDVMNKQREIIYAERRRILEGANLRDTILGFLIHTVEGAVDIFCPASETSDNWDTDELYEGLSEYFPLPSYAQPEDLKGRSRGDLVTGLTAWITEAYAAKEMELAAVTGDEEMMRNFERHVGLQAINSKWMEHLAAMDYLREGIFLRGYAQQDPLLVYQKEGFELFETMQHSIQDEVARTMFRLQLVNEQQEQAEPEEPKKIYNDWESWDGGGSGRPTAVTPGPTVQAPATKPGRNEACWCGSGKKYKSCHYPN
ncbi:MAG: SEC-C metal-binding domain-containing protein [Chthonomonadales bacterium]